MRTLVTHAWRTAARDPRRTAAAAIGSSISVALVMAVVLFGIASSATTTQRALADLPIDAQAVLTQGADAAAATRLLSADPAVAAVLPLDLVHFTAAASATSETATQTGTGVVVGIDAAYRTSTGLFKLSEGGVAAGRVAISRDLASNLGVTPGDTITLSLPEGASTKLVVSGIVDTAGSDVLLGPTDPSHRAAGLNPPVNVAVTDRATLAAIAARVPVGAIVPLSSGGTSAPSVTVDEPAVRHEFDLRYNHALIAGGPAEAQSWLDQVRRRLEIRAAGGLTIADDATEALAPVAGDLAWGSVLFIFLALPGVLLALVLPHMAAESASDITRQHAALLRSRGAGRRQLLGVFVGAEAFASITGGLAGAGVGAVVAWALIGRDLWQALNGVELVVVAAAAIIVVAGLASASAALRVRAQLAGQVQAGRQDLEAWRAPLWRRLYLDLVALGTGIGVFWLVSSGVHPVLTSEGNPTVTLALTSFLAPLLVWVGASLLLTRIVGRTLRDAASVPASLERALGAGGRLAGASLQSRIRPATQVVVLIALALSFIVSVLVFDATYRQQQRVDAALTLGADLRAVPTHPTPANAAALAVGPGVESATPFADRVVYVGSEAQDLLAVDPTTLPATAPLADTFFRDMTAADAMKALAREPDAILVSAETARDYSIVAGDRIRIRIPDAKGVLRSVDFHMAGIALEFPTAPRDAFLVANLAYVAQQTGDSHISFILARAAGDRAAEALRARLGAGWEVTDLAQVHARLANTVASVDLGNLVAIVLGFGLLILAIGTALFLIADLSSRTRELATLVAVGADQRHIRRMIIGETTLVGAAGMVGGIAAGGAVAVTLLAVLAGIFDPPAQWPAVPIIAILGSILASGAGLASAVLAATRASRTIDVAGALRER